MVRSLLGIACGVLVIALLGTMANAVVFHGAATGPMPLPVEALLLLMHLLAAVAGGYLGVAVARRRPATHGFAIGVAYLLAVQIRPDLAGHMTPGAVVQPLWMTGVGMAVALAGAAIGGAARGQAVR